MTEVFANFAQSTLSAPISAAQTTITIATPAAGHTFPATGNFRIVVQSFDPTTLLPVSGYELMLVTAVSGNTFTVTRGAESTTAMAFASGATVAHVVTAAVMANLESSGSPGGSNAQLQYNNSGSFGGDTATTDGSGNWSATSLILGGLTASEIVATDSSFKLQSLSTATYPSLTELSYVKGVTSSIQTQLNTKGSGTVTTTGSPASGNLTKFSGSTSITNGDLSGDVTTSGTLATTVAKVNGVTYGTSPPTNTVPVVTGTNAVTYEAVPNAALANSSITLNTHSVSLGGSLSLNATDIGLGNVTNDTQTKAAIVPNTAPSTGQILVGNAGGTAYAPNSLSGSGATMSLSSAGVLSISAIANASLSNSSITIAGHTVALGGTQTLTASDLTNGTTGSGSIVLATSPVLVTPNIDTPSAGTLTNCTGLPTAGLVNNAVTYAKMQQASGSVLLGNPTGSTANISEITLGASLAFSSTTVNTIQDIRTTATPQFAHIGIGTAGASTIGCYGFSNLADAGYVQYYGDVRGRVTTSGVVNTYGQQIDVKVSVASGQTNTAAGRGMFNNLLRNFDPALVDYGTQQNLYGISTHCGHYQQFLYASPVTTNAYGFYNLPYLLTGVITNYYGLYLDNANVLATPSTWAATTSYSSVTPSRVKPSVSNGYYFVCTTSGTSGGSEPTWVTGAGNTTTDGTVVWTAVAIPAITNYWGIYQADSTAKNYLNGVRTLVGTLTDDGSTRLQINGALSISSATMIKTNTTFTNGAAANTGTLTNAPAAGNPTKWIPINDNGTTRYIPAW